MENLNLHHDVQYEERENKDHIVDDSYPLQ